MTLDPKAVAALALHRFGFGPRAGSIAAIASDPRGALLAELDASGRRPARRPRVAERRAVGARRVRFPRRAPAPSRSSPSARPRKRRADGGDNSMEAIAGRIRAPRPPSPSRHCRSRCFCAEASARIDAAVERAEIGFVERLVWFWSNHFCVSADKVPSMAGGYEREAIRPHVLGRFADMLLAAEGHPAMLFYLDNFALDRPELGRRHQSQPRAEREPRARNPRAAYARRAHRLHPGRRHQLRQGADRLDHHPVGANPEHGGEFVFNPRMHEPGAQTVIGKAYPRHRTSSRAARCWPISRAIRRPPRMSRASWRAISSPTSRRRRWSSG